VGKEAESEEEEEEEEEDEEAGHHQATTVPGTDDFSLSVGLAPGLGGEQGDHEVDHVLELLERSLPQSQFQVPREENHARVRVWG